MATEASVKDAASTAGRAPSTPDGEGSIDYEHRRTVGAPKGGLLSGTDARVRRRPHRIGAPLARRVRRSRAAPVRAVPCPHGVRSSGDRGGPRRATPRTSERASGRECSSRCSDTASSPPKATSGCGIDDWRRRRSIATGRRLRPDDGPLHPGRRRLRGPTGETVDLHDEMTALTLRIVARTLFDTDVTARIEEVARIGASIQDFYYLRFASLRFLIPTWLPTPGNRRLSAATRRLDDVVYGIIRERRPGEDRGDLLSMLLLARDEQGAGMSERQVRDEVMTLLLAGHETTALALSWAFLLLGPHPDARESLDTEIAAVLGRQARVPDRRAGAALYPGRRQRDASPVTHRPMSPAVRRSAPRRWVACASRSATSSSSRCTRPIATRGSSRSQTRSSPERWLDGLEKRLPQGGVHPIRPRVEEVRRCLVRDDGNDAPARHDRPPLAL